MNSNDTPKSTPVAPAKPAKKQRAAIVHTQDRNPGDREQWKRDRAKALGHAPKPAGK